MKRILEENVRWVDLTIRLAVKANSISVRSMILASHLRVIRARTWTPECGRHWHNIIIPKEYAYVIFIACKNVLFILNNIHLYRVKLTIHVRLIHMKQIKKQRR